MKRVGIPLCLLAMLATGPALTQAPPSSDDIVRALDPSQQQPRTRSLRGITVEEGEAKPPSIDLQVLFEYDSDKLTNEGILTLRRLGAALKDPKLATYRFKVAGHTDAKGSAEYNQKLSERRAASVRRFLVSEYKLEDKRIESAGYGKSQLADPARPEDGINRRVQIINLGTK